MLNNFPQKGRNFKTILYFSQGKYCTPPKGFLCVPLCILLLLHRKQEAKTRRKQLLNEYSEFGTPQGNRIRLLTQAIIYPKRRKMRCGCSGWVRCSELGEGARQTVASEGGDRPPPPPTPTKTTPSSTSAHQGYSHAILHNENGQLRLTPG